MVRAHVKQTPEEKKEKPKKKTHSKKKVSDLGAWPCTINDCSKVFAREADLKRHQRTTKGHSEPAYACPQCDATFTRTDALRRHQKSRHNGVVVESSADANSSGTAKDGSDESVFSSSSRESTPVKREVDEPKVKKSPPKPEPTRASYYRQHTMQPTYNSPLPPPPPIFMDGQYPHAIAIPTSAARLSWPGWSGPPPWAAEGPIASAPPPPSQAIYHVPPPYYHPSPYYRHYGPPMMSSIGPHGYPPPHFHPEYVPHYSAVMYSGAHTAPHPPQPGQHSRTPSGSSSKAAPSSPKSGSVADASGDEMESDNEDAEGSDNEDIEDEPPTSQTHDRQTASPASRSPRVEGPAHAHANAIEVNCVQDVHVSPANRPKEVNGFTASEPTPSPAVEVADLPAGSDHHRDVVTKHVYGPARAISSTNVARALSEVVHRKLSSEPTSPHEPVELLLQASTPHAIAVANR